MARYTRREIADLRTARTMRWLWATRAMIPVGAYGLLFFDKAFDLRTSCGLPRDFVTALRGAAGAFETPVVLLAFGVCCLPFRRALWRADSERAVRIALSAVWTLVLWPVGLLATAHLPAGVVAAPAKIPPDAWRYGILPGVVIVALWAVFFRPLTRRFLKGLGFFYRVKTSPFK